MTDADRPGYAAITGLGVVSPAGSDVDTFWTTMLAGKSMARRIDRLAELGLPVDFGCPVSGFDARARLSAKESRRMDPFTQYAVAAALDAHASAGSPSPEPSRGAVVVGNGAGGTHTQYEETRRLLESGPERVNPLCIPMAMANAPAALIGQRLGWQGPNITVTTACASGGHAIGEGLRLLREGAADVVLAGGAEAPLTALSMSAFWKLLSRAMRPCVPAHGPRSG